VGGDILVKEASGAYMLRREDHYLERVYLDTDGCQCSHFGNGDIWVCAMPKPYILKKEDNYAERVYLEMDGSLKKKETGLWSTDFLEDGTYNIIKNGNGDRDIMVHTDSGHYILYEREGYAKKNPVQIPFDRVKLSFDYGYSNLEDQDGKLMGVYDSAWNNILPEEYQHSDLECLIGSLVSCSKEGNVYVYSTKSDTRTQWSGNVARTIYDYPNSDYLYFQIKRPDKETGEMIYDHILFDQNGNSYLLKSSIDWEGEGADIGDGNAVFRTTGSDGRKGLLWYGKKPAFLDRDDVQDGWTTMAGIDYWYEGGVRQGYDPSNPDYRGKEIYDPGTDAWYWLDNVQQGAKAVSKDVYQESYSAYPDREDGTGKWVRYDENGHMVKGWQSTDVGVYYFEPVTGAMAKGAVTIDGQDYLFDEVTGIMK